ncbi:hypothetical protein QBC44DRAFT_306170 [Cladorrhinum sp. PSN332]|nr:hypothetical protein QBC44DRAFT_306170 [Cladorrhinum sp. PSN332]
MPFAEAVLPWFSCLPLGIGLLHLHLRAFSNPILESGASVRVRRQRCRCNATAQHIRATPHSEWASIQIPVAQARVCRGMSHAERITSLKQPPVRAANWSVVEYTYLVLGCHLPSMDAQCTMHNASPSDESAVEDLSACVSGPLVELLPQMG